MEIINNISKTLKDDLNSQLKENSSVSIAASCFSMYAYSELKKQFEAISELRFIFTSPTFLAEKAESKQREFYIPRLSREKNLYGSEFEVKLRNELTQKAIAKECAEWIKKKKVKFRSNTGNDLMGGFIVIETPEETISYNPVQNFTTVDLGCEQGNTAYTMITKTEAPYSKQFLQLFDSIWQDPKKMQDVTNEVMDSINTVYQENSPEFIYFLTLYNIFKEFLEDLSEDVVPNEKIGYNDSLIWQKLYPFQRHAALAIINKLERYNGCILADSVGLGKTFTALAVIKYYENRNKSVLVLCPKKLQDNWNTFKGNYLNNPIAQDKLNYHVLFHTDLSREDGYSNGIDLSRLNWGNFDLVVIDESHNFRNGGTVSISRSDPAIKLENRYLRLQNRVIRSGVKTKVLMLSATPVNNRFFDLYNQIKLAYEGDNDIINERLNLKKDRDIEYIFRQAQAAFNEWSKKEQKEKTTANLLRMLDYDFFGVLDSVTIARSRKHIEKYYSDTTLQFPKRNKPITIRPFLATLDDAINYNDIYSMLDALNLSIYTPSVYILPSMLTKYEKDTELGKRLTQTGREMGIQQLMNINLLKRLESSIHSFRLTLSRIKDQISNTICILDNYNTDTEISPVDLDNNDLDLDDENIDIFTVGKKNKIALKDMDYNSWKNDLSKDLVILNNLIENISKINPENDNKLNTLFSIIEEKFLNPINPNNRKILIFSAYADTVAYLYDHVSIYVKNKFGLNTGMITGTIDGKTTIQKLKTDFNNVLTAFSPLSKIGKPIEKPIDILIGTDCISEGQNLQDCDYCINYDIHWNPVRIIQRFGRIDRIGSQNDVIQLVNFWPDMDLDEYLDLKNRVETRMKASVLASTGTLEDNPIDDENGDLEYRKAQLKRLQEEVVDIEEMQTGISIMDLGLNEFRLDLQEFIKHNYGLETSPHGLHAIVPSVSGLPSGTIFILKNVNDKVNIDKQNRLHPFYMVYISAAGEVVRDYLSPKKILDEIRLLCLNKKEPFKDLYSIFNYDTKDGNDMHSYSKLLHKAIQSIIQTKKENDIESLFRRGGTTASVNEIKGINDFELIAFLVIRNNE